MKILWIALIICFNLTISKAQLPNQPNQLLRIHIGAYQFADGFELVDKIRGNSLGLTYERFLFKHWSFSLGVEYCINNNPIVELKKRNQTLTLPEKEHRFAIANDVRYYITKTNKGLYLGNSLAVQKLFNIVQTSLCHSLNSPCKSIDVYNPFAIADRLTLGYQAFITNKATLGISFGYEWRFFGSYGPRKSPQIALHFGIAK